MPPAWTQLKRQMRRVVHQSMGRPAYLLARVGTSIYTEISVRGPHTKGEIKTVGQGAGEGWSEREDTQPRLIFDRIELQTKNLKLIPNQTIISLEEGEAYRIGPSRPRDDQWLVVEVVPLTALEAAGLPVPETA